MRRSSIAKAIIDITSTAISNLDRRRDWLRELKLTLAPKYAGTPSLPDIYDEYMLKNLIEALSRKPVEEAHMQVSESKLATCLDCVVKHLSTAKIAAREALQRAEAKEPPEKVIEKIREIHGELAGMELDIKDRDIPEIMEIDDSSRRLRKEIFDNKWLINPPTIEQLREIEKKISLILEKSYNAIGKYLR